MLPRAQKQHRNPRRMHHTDQRAHHIAHGVALADNEPVQAPAGAKGRVEVARLLHAVGADERLADHENLIGLGELGEFLERGHQALVVVPSPGGVDEDDVEVLRSGVGDGVFGDVGCVLAVALLVELDLAAFAGGEFLEVAGVHAELFDGAGAEGVAGGDEDFEFVLKEEEADFGEVGGFADAVDADDGDYVGAAVLEGESGGVGDGLDFAEEVERGGWGEDFAEGGFHGGADGCFNSCDCILAELMQNGLEYDEQTYIQSCQS